jgi:hypothetical protein
VSHVAILRPLCRRRTSPSCGNAIDRTGDEFVDPEEAAPDLWAALAPDFELHGRPDVPGTTTYRGREATKEFWRMLQDVWAELWWEPLDFTISAMP